MRGGNVISLTGEGADNSNNTAILEFTQPEHDARLFSTWYSPETVKYLLHSSVNASRCLRYVFWDSQDDVALFTAQLSCLITLANTLHRPAVFISKEPGNPFHWIGGIVEKNNLFLFNPAGLTKHTSFYEALASLQKGSGSLLKKVVLSTTVLQCDPSGFVSCGPLCAEWAMEVSEQGNVLEGFLACFKPEADQQQVGLHYAVVDITPHLSGLLATLNSSLSTEVYQEKLIRLRANHLEQLQSRSQIALEKDTSFSFDRSLYWENCLEAPEQQLIFRLVHPDSNDRLHFLNIEESPLYQQLQTSLQVKSTPPTRSAVVTSRREISKNTDEPIQDNSQSKKSAHEITIARQGWDDNLKKAGDLLKEGSSSEILKEAEECCVNALKSANQLEGDEKQQALSVGFEVLGDIYVKKGNLFEKDLLKRHREKLKAVTLYNMALASETQYSEGRKNLSELTSAQQPLALNDNQQRFIQKIQQSENELLFSCGGIPRKENAETYWQEIQASRDILADISKEARIALEKVEIDSPDIQTIYQKIAFGLREALVKKLINDCFELLPLPEGCVYSIMVLGSIAREEATPYSDFEWAILIEDQGEEKNQKHKEYFRRLTELVWIKILNLRETTARMMDIESLSWFPESESPTKKGFSFDGQMMDGCHTPLGNKHHTEVKIAAIQNSGSLTEQEKENEIQKIKLGEYELIGTAQELADFQQDKWESKRGFQTVLSTVDLIISNDGHLKEKNLLNFYQKHMEDIWETPVRKEKEDSDDVSPQTLIQKRSLKFLAESNERFQFRGGRFDKECHYFDAKYHLYRLPNMVVDHLASYFYFDGVKSKNLWDRIGELFGEKGVVLNTEGEINLRTTVSIILRIRLSVYLEKGYRDDHIMPNAEHPERSMSFLEKYLGVTQKLLFDVFSVFIPLQWTMEQFVEKNGLTEILVKSAYYYPSPSVKGHIFKLLLDYPNAAKSYEEAKFQDGSDNITLAETLNNLGNVYAAQGRYVEAVEAYEESKRIKTVMYDGVDHISLADTLNNLGLVYRTQGRYAEAVKAHEESKRIKTVVYDAGHISVAVTLNNLGMVYADQGRYAEALAVFEEAKRIIEKVHGVGHIWVAETLNNLGNVYRNQGRYAEALAVFEKAKRIIKRVHGAGHISMAGILNNLGMVYRNQGRYAEALAVFEEAKRIIEKVHGVNHIWVAETLNNLGLVYRTQGRYAEALGVYEKAERIKIEVYGPKHINMVDILNGLGLVAIEQRRFSDARILFQQVSDIYCIQSSQPDKTPENPDLRCSFLREGNGYLLQEKMDIESARSCYQQLDPLLDPNNPETHQNLADHFYTTNNLSATIEHYRVLLRLKPDAASAHHNLACMLHIRAQIEKDKDDKAGYQAYLKEAQGHFREAIRLDPHTGVYTEYALFMWKNRAHYSLEFIIDMLQKSIDLGQIDKELMYGLMERPTVDENLQRLIDHEKEISFKAYFLAHYLLIQIYIYTHRINNAKEILSAFKNLEESYQQEYAMTESLLKISEYTIMSCLYVFGLQNPAIIDEIAYRIFQKLDQHSVRQARLVNRHWSKLCSSLLIWQPLKSSNSFSLSGLEDSMEANVTQTMS